MYLLRAYRSGGGAPLLVRSFDSLSTAGASLGVAYQVIPPTPVGTNYTATFGVNTKATADLTPQFAVRNSATLDLAPQYAVQGVVIELRRLLRPMRSAAGLKLLVIETPTARPVLDFTASWNMGGVVARTLAPVWNVMPPTMGDANWLGDAFVVSVAGLTASGAVAMDSPLATVSRDLIGQYQVQAQASGGLDWQSTAFTVSTGTISASGAAAFTSTQLTVNQDLNAQWSMRQAVQVSYSSRHTIYVPVGNDYTSYFSLTGLSAVSGDLVSEYQMAGITGAQRLFSHGVLNAVGRAQASAFSILDPNSVALEILPRWNVLAPAYSDLVAAYDSGGRVWGDALYAWNTGEIPVVGVVATADADQVVMQALLPGAAFAAVMSEASKARVLQ